MRPHEPLVTALLAVSFALVALWRRRPWRTGTGRAFQPLSRVPWRPMCKLSVMIFAVVRILARRN